MSDKDLVHAGPVRHGIVEAMIGGAVALVAITVAHASLPDLAPAVAPARAPAAPRTLAQIAPPLPPAAAPVLIAFRAPLPDGHVGSPFGLRQLPWEEHGRLHAGVDMIAPAPEPVLASADGVVIRTGQDPGYGRFVELKHAEGMVTLYGHLDRFAPGVTAGAALKAGAPVGRLGSTGTSTGAHLHFEVHDPQGRPLNPELLLGHAYASAGDLPLREARRVPRRVRVAYVSRIPKNKQAVMQARLADDLAEQAADGAADVDGQATDPTASSPPAAPARHRHGRVHVRLRS